MEAAALDFKGCILAKPHVNENNNLTNSCGGILGSLRSQGGQDPLKRFPAEDGGKEGKERQVRPADEDDVEEEEEDSRSSESKPPLSPILSAPTTIRFPAREPEKDRQQATDSGVCRWDKCEESFESSGELLEHLQVNWKAIPFHSIRFRGNSIGMTRVTNLYRVPRLYIVVVVVTPCVFGTQKDSDLSSFLSSLSRREIDISQQHFGGYRISGGYIGFQRTWSTYDIVLAIKNGREKEKRKGNDSFV